MPIRMLKMAALACAAMAALAAAPASQAQESPAKKGEAAAETKDDAKADAILAKLRGYYRGLKSYTFDAVMDNRTEVQGMKIDMKVKYKAAVAEPNKFAFIGEGDSAGAMGGMSLSQSVVSDGETLYRYIKMVNSYTQEPAPKTLDGIVFGGMDPMGADAMLFGMFTEPEKSFSVAKSLKRKEYQGLETIDGAECHKIRLVSGAPSIPDLEDAPEGMELATFVWVETGERPLIRKISPDFGGMLKTMFGGGDKPTIAPDGDPGLDAAMNEMLAGMKMEIAFLYSNWNTAAEIPADSFKFSPPAGAKKTDNFMDAMGGDLGALGGAAEEEEGPEEPATALQGKPAPALKLPLLAGGEFDLAAQKGKVVVLDFWATWCGPCVKAMPVVKAATDAFKDKGVVFVAVNLEEKADKVKAFLEKNKLDVAVALDGEGEAGSLYKANSIPQTVVIGKDGVVKKVHIGFGPKMKEELTAEITAALAE